MIECMKWDLCFAPDGKSLYFKNSDTEKIMKQEMHTTKFGNHLIEYDMMENKITCNICDSQNMENAKN